MARFRLVPNQSELWAEARSSLHPVRVHTAELTGAVGGRVGEDRPMLATPTYVEARGAAASLGQPAGRRRLQRRIDTRTYPTIRAELTGAAQANAAGTLRLTGTLTFHGITRTLDVEVTVRQPDPGTLVIEGGRPIDMRDFGLPPPSFLMFRMDSRVQVRARLVATREKVTTD
jgi:hypothetical protein